MKILAIDSAHGTCSAAYFNGDKVVSEIVEEMERGQAERLLPMVQDVLKRAGAGFEEIEAVAVTTGPGSFTGVRVGLAAADGIALAAGLPMIGVSVLETLAWKIHRRNSGLEKLCLVLETKRDDFYIQRYNRGVPLEEPAAKTAGEIKAFCSEYAFAGNGVNRLIEEIGDVNVCAVSMPTAADVALLASGRQPQKEFPAAMYLREAEVTVCRK
ncbi:MAG: tRNA (adenosine(37)-N6)-threonylcarbamoyltransferase complex dimerization subunit type 1 TsaB [Alphaproteobacteria bacterium]